jgi:hypothetical protein
MKKLPIFSISILLVIGVLLTVYFGKQQTSELKAQNEILKKQIQVLQSQLLDSNRMVQISEARSAMLRNELGRSTNDVAALRIKLDQIEEQSAENAKRPGTLKFNVTYKYNDFVGNRADTGALVSLFSINQIGSYSEKVGGNGYAVINNVVPGKYLCTILSANAEGASLSQEDIDLIQKYLNPELAKLELNAGRTLHMKAMLVEIVPGQKTELSHDFGPSQF